MSQGKGSRQRPFSISPDDYARRYRETFTERERRLANDPKEHAKRLRSSARLHGTFLAEPEGTVDNVPRGTD